MPAFKLPDDTPLRFGKYDGKTPKQIAGFDCRYIVWLYDTVVPKVCTKRLRDLCDSELRPSYEEEKEMDMIYGLDGWDN